MPQSPIATTATASLATAGGASTLVWLTHWPITPMPEDVALFLAAGLAPLVHLAFRALAARLTRGTPFPGEAPLEISPSTRNPGEPSHAE